MEDKQKLIDEVIETIKKDVDTNDLTALNVFLNDILTEETRELFVMYLPDESWVKFKE